MEIRLRAIRESQNLKVAQMVERLGIKDSRYRKWESNSSQIPLDMACRCADILHCTLDELAGRKSPTELSSDERMVVNCMRETDARGRDVIMRVAEGELGVERKTPTNNVNAAS